MYFYFVCIYKRYDYIFLIEMFYDVIWLFEFILIKKIFVGDWLNGLNNVVLLLIEYIEGLFVFFCYCFLLILEICIENLEE